MKLRHLLAASSIYSLLLTGVFAQSATKSLSGDNWKNPNRTKTWTPPANTDTLVGNSTPAVLSNKELSAPVISSPSFTGSVQGDLSVTGAVTSSNPAITSNTNISATTQFVKQSTSNLNSLVDGSFEGSTLTEWVLSTTGTKTIATSGCVDTPTNSKCMSVVSSLANILTNTWSGGASLPAKTSAVCEGWLKTDKDTDVTVTLGTSTIARKTITGDGVWRKFYLNYSTNGTDSPKCEVRNPATTNYLLDITSHGVKDETGVMAKFDNTTGWTACTFSAGASWGGFGTPTNTNKLYCKRNGANLEMSGYFTAGTSSASSAIIPFPNNFGEINVASRDANILVGSFTRYFTTNSKGGTLLINSTINTKAIYFSSSSYIGSGNINGMYGAYSNEVVTTGESIAILASIPIAEWSSQTNAAIVACQQNDLTCYDNLEANISNTGVVTYPNGQLPWINGNCSLVSGGVVNCLYVASLGLQNAMECSPTAQSVAYNQSIARNTTGNNNLGFSLVTGTNGVAAFISFTITCRKTGVDKKNPDKVYPLENFYVDANEIVVGYDRIDNKTIYQRCHKVVSNITGTNQQLVAWPSLLNPIGHPKVASTDDWTIYHVNTQSQNYIIYYFRTTGALQYVQGAGTQYLGAGTKICMKYTR